MTYIIYITFVHLKVVLQVWALLIFHVKCIDENIQYTKSLKKSALRTVYACFAVLY